jgi:hypothetical protein
VDLVLYAMAQHDEARREAGAQQWAGDVADVRLVSVVEQGAELHLRRHVGHASRDVERVPSHRLPSHVTVEAADTGEAVGDLVDGE